MSVSFRESFLAHLDASGISVTDVAKGAGVSREALYKLKQRRVESTNAEDAVKVARFFGKSLEEFMGRPPDPRIAEIMGLFCSLSQTEQGFLRAQIEALAARRGRGSRRPDEDGPEARQARHHPAR